MLATRHATLESESDTGSETKDQSADNVWNGPLLPRTVPIEWDDNGSKPRPCPDRVNATDQAGFVTVTMIVSLDDSLEPCIWF